MKLSNKYIFLVVEILVKDWIDYLFFAFREKIPIEVDGFFKQQVAMSTIQSNDIEHDSYLFLRNQSVASLRNCTKFICGNFNKIFSLVGERICMNWIF